MTCINCGVDTTDICQQTDDVTEGEVMRLDGKVAIVTGASRAQGAGGSVFCITSGAAQA